MKKTCRMSVNFTDKQYKYLESLSNVNNISLAEAVRLCVNEKLNKPHITRFIIILTDNSTVDIDCKFDTEYLFGKHFFDDPDADDYGWVRYIYDEPYEILDMWHTVTDKSDYKEYGLYYNGTFYGDQNVKDVILEYSDGKEHTLHDYLGKYYSN